MDEKTLDEHLKKLSEQKPNELQAHSWKVAVRQRVLETEKSSFLRVL